MWIKRTDDGHLINIKDCVDIKKGINYKYGGDEKHIESYYLCFEWTKGNFKIHFDTEEQRDNFYSHLVDYLKPVEIDPNSKPIKL